MTRDDLGLIPQNSPLIFADGTDAYKKLAQKYITHKKGYFILAPSGSGKTHFVNNQKEKHWIDGDNLWEAAFAHPAGPWWIEPISVTDEIDQRSDVITVQAKKLGFWIVGSANNWLKPDAVVIPHWSTHKKYIKNRESNNYDGGATSERFAQVLHHRNWIMKWTKKGVPRFKSMEEAVGYLENEYKGFL